MFTEEDTFVPKFQCSVCGAITDLVFVYPRNLDDRSHWAHILRTSWRPTLHLDWICGDHFAATEFSNIFRNRLKPSAVPRAPIYRIVCAPQILRQMGPIPLATNEETFGYTRYEFEPMHLPGQVDREPDTESAEPTTVEFVDMPRRFPFRQNYKKPVTNREPLLYKSEEIDAVPSKSAWSVVHSATKLNVDGLFDDTQTDPFIPFGGKLPPATPQIVQNHTMNWWHSEQKLQQQLDLHLLQVSPQNILEDVQMENIADNVFASDDDRIASFVPSSGPQNGAWPKESRI